MRGQWFAIALIAGTAGCVDYSPPPPRVEVPPVSPAEPRDYPETEPIKPLPLGGASADERFNASAPGSSASSDRTPGSQLAPLQRHFIEAWDRVGRPKIAVVVERPQGGNMSPADANAKSAETQPTPASEVTALYLAPDGTSSEWRKALDFEVVEQTLSEWILCGGAITVISSQMATSADVVVRVQTRPPEASATGAQTSILAEAVNARDGEVLGRGSLDLPLPADRAATNKATRYLAGQLMQGMMNTWTSRGAKTNEPPATLPSR